jgi:hypothetical protein
MPPDRMRNSGTAAVEPGGWENLGDGNFVSAAKPAGCLCLNLSVRTCLSDFVMFHPTMFRREPVESHEQRAID